MTDLQVRADLIEAIRLRGAQIHDREPAAPTVTVHYRRRRFVLHISNTLLGAFSRSSEAQRAELIDKILDR